MSNSDTPSLSPKNPQNVSLTSQNEAAITNDHESQTLLSDQSANNKLAAPETVNEALLSDQTVASSQPTLLTAENQQNGGHLELLEERPVVSKERVDVGKVIVTKHSRTKTINVPIELLEEYITVQTEFSNNDDQNLLTGNYDDKDVIHQITPTLDNKAVVTINGNQVEISDAPIEIVISRQVATISKETYAVQEVSVSKTTHTHTDSIAVELKHEELLVSEEGFLSHPKKA